MRVLAPAKVNLCLRVLGRRADGYHELDSIFLPLDLADELEVELVPGGGVECHCPGHEALGGGENLAARAARLFLAACDPPGGTGVTIRIHKRIWIAAGLGGGSSDAAGVLRALERELGPTGIPLESLALRLGADVPYFLDPRPARVRGIGERREPIEVPSWPLVLLNPGIPLGTREVFAELGLAPGAHGPSRELAAGELATLREAPWRVAGNDLRAAAVRLCPPIARLEAALADEGALAVTLSGSGPTVLGIFDGLEAASRAGERLRRRGIATVAVTMTASS